MASVHPQDSVLPGLRYPVELGVREKGGFIFQGKPELSSYP